MAVQASARQHRRLKILVVTAMLPKPDQSGGGLRTFGFLALLAETHRVSLLSYFESNEVFRAGDPGTIARYQDQYRQANIRIEQGYDLTGLTRVLLAETFDVVLFEFWTSAHHGIALVHQFQPWAKVIIETVDIHFRREADAASIGLMDSQLAAANKLAELAIYRQASALICISDEDFHALDEWPDLGHRVVIPHMAQPTTRPDLSRGAELLFIGGFAHRPNPDGIVWFGREIWPTVRHELPDAHLRVVGSSPTPEVLDLATIAGIDVVGWVPDITPLCDRAAVLIAPLRFGGGVKIKVVEAMARGLPVITTPVGAQGLAVRSGDQLVIAADGPDFARAVVELLRDPARAERIGRAGRDHVAATCSPAATRQKLEAMLAAVVDRGRPRLPPPRWLAQSAVSRARKVLGQIKRQIRRRPG